MRTDGRRQSAAPLELTIRRHWVGYARFQASGRAADELFRAWRTGDDPCAVKLTESDAEFLADVCERSRPDRRNTADAIREAIKAAKAPPEEFDGRGHLKLLEELGELTDSERAAMKRLSGRMFE